MSDLRKAAQQALEFIEEGSFVYPTQLADDLRDALAQEQTNGSWHDGLLEGQLRERERWLAQEPAAWNWMLDGRPYGQAYYGNPPDADIAERAATAGRTVRLLYAAPQPQRPPLTDEEIAEVYREWDVGPWANIAEFARAIERKVRGE